MEEQGGTAVVFLLPLLYFKESEKILKSFSATFLTVCRGIKIKLGV